MMSTLIRRDVTLIARSPVIWLSSLVFFVLFLTLCVIALGGDHKVMRPLAPAFIWLGTLFSLLLSFGTLFQTDMEDGSLANILLSGLSPLNIAISRAVALFICILLPVIAASSLAGLVFNIPGRETAGIVISLFISTPALVSYGILTAALMAGKPQSGFLGIIITAPFLIPVLIFGVAAVDSYAVNGLSGAEFKALAGISLIGLAIGLPAAGAALRANVE